ncbi:MAG: F0F1 ATP synthase subunit B [Chlorobiota bacterium]
MPNFLEVSPGLMFWTLLNFGIFLVLLARFAWKPILNAVEQRERTIAEALSSAETARREAERLLQEAHQRLQEAQQEVHRLLREGKQQAEALLREASERAEQLKRQKLEETQLEIQRQLERAYAQLYADVVNLVIEGTARLLQQTLDPEAHRKLVESFVNEVARQN